MDYYKDKKELVQNIFENHVAKLETTKTFGQELHHIRWYEPGTTIGFIEYILHGRTLRVSGDYGSSVYTIGWDDTKTMSLLSFLNMSIPYFLSKNDTFAFSPESGILTFNTKMFKKQINEHKENMEGWDSDLDDIVAEFNPDSSREWVEYINAHQEEIEEVFGLDYWEYAYDFGLVPGIPVLSHYWGIKWAVQQLIDKGELQKEGSI